MEFASLPNLPLFGTSLAGDILEPGAVIGPYEILELLSFGMGGGLYKARLRREGKPVTLLMLPGFVARNREFRRNLQAAKSLFELSGSNILKMKRIEWAEGLCAIEMEPVDARPLEHLLFERAEAGEGVLPVSEAKEILLGVLGALSTAHALGVCHFNLVPSNILILEGGGTMVAGFGMFELIGQDLLKQLASAAVPPVQQPTARLTLMSTELRSPEVQAGHELTRASDIYHFGLLAYFLLTGQKFGGKRASEVRPDLGPKWDIVLGRCMVQDPLKRYKAISRIRQDIANLDHLQPGGGLWCAQSVRPIDKSRLPLRLTARTRKLALMIGGISVLLLGGLLAAYLYSEDQGEAPVLVTQVSDPGKARFRLSISPQLAKVTLTGAAVGSFIIQDGSLWADMPPGEYEVKLEAGNHLTQSLSIQVPREGTEQQVVLLPRDTTLSIRTIPGARVDVVTGDDARRFLGYASTNGTLSLENRLFARDYIIAVSAEGYQTRNRSVSLELGANEALHIPLAAEAVNLAVSVWPEGTSIWVDDQLAGKAPLVLEGIPSGRSIQVRAEHPGYRPSVAQLYLQPGQDFNLNLGSLELRQGSVVVRPRFALGSSIQQPTIRVGDDVMLPEEVALLPEGQHQLVVEHPDYHTYTQTIRVGDAAQLRLEPILQPKPGLLTVELGGDQSFQLLADGTPVFPGADGSFTITPGKTVELELHAPDALPHRRRLRFEPNEHVTWTIQLQSVPGPQNGLPWVVPYLAATLNWIEPGNSTMGSLPTEPDSRPDETPITIVNFSRGFWAGITEVTQSVYFELMGANPSEFQGPNLPVHNVSWRDAMDFCRRLTERESKAGRLPDGYEYRLPTEAEWEYFARAGSSTPFSFGGSASSREGNFQGIYPRNLDGDESRTTAHYGVVPAASYPANSWGIHDVHGNVAEWCLNLFNSRLPGGEVTDWFGPSTGRDRPVRGGSWKDYAHRCRSGARDRLDPRTVSNAMGFRIVLAPRLEDPDLH